MIAIARIMQPVELPKTELARKTRQVLREVQRGYTVLIESHGQAEAVILDIVDYRIVRGFMAYHTRPPKVNPQVSCTTIGKDG